MDLQTLWCLWQIWSMCGRGAVWGVIWEHSGLSGVRHSPIHSCWRSSYWWWWWWRSFFLAVFKQDLGENNCDLRPLRKPKRVREKIRTGCFALKLLLRQQFDSSVDWCLFLFLQQSVEKFWPFGVLKMFLKVDGVFSACCYLQSFILSFHGRRQAISCLLNLMAPLSPRSALLGTQPTPPDLSLFSLGPAWNIYKHINTRSTRGASRSGSHCIIFFNEQTCKLILEEEKMDQKLIQLKISFIF